MPTLCLLCAFSVRTLYLLYGIPGNLFIFDLRGLSLLQGYANYKVGKRTLTLTLTLALDLTPTPTLTLTLIYAYP